MKKNKFYIIASAEGFTLIEILVVTLLLSCMSAILYGTINGIIKAQKVVEEQREVGREAAFLLEHITQELSSKAMIPLFTKEDEAKAGNQTRHYLIGLNKNKTNAGADQIRFTTHNLTGQNIKIVSSGIIEVEYRLERLKDSTARRPVYALIRSETPAGLTDTKLYEKQTITQELSNRVIGFDLRYLDDEQWRDSFNDVSDEDQYIETMPRAIEISLTLSREDGGEELFRTAVALR